MSGVVFESLLTGLRLFLKILLAANLSLTSSFVPLEHFIRALAISAIADPVLPSKDPFHDRRACLPHNKTYLILDCVCVRDLSLLAWFTSIVRETNSASVDMSSVQRACLAITLRLCPGQTMYWSTQHPRLNASLT